MIKPEQLAVQLDEAIDHAMVEGDKPRGRGWQGVLNTIEDPNHEEAGNHVEMLLRYPQALDAIRHIKDSSREYLKGFLNEVPEFKHILGQIEGEEAK